MHGEQHPFAPIECARGVDTLKARLWTTFFEHVTSNVSTVIPPRFPVDLCIDAFPWRKPVRRLHWRVLAGNGEASNRLFHRCTQRSIFAKALHTNVIEEHY